MHSKAINLGPRAGSGSHPARVFLLQLVHNEPIVSSLKGWILSKTEIVQLLGCKFAHLAVAAGSSNRPRSERDDPGEPKSFHLTLYTDRLEALFWRFGLQ